MPSSPQLALRREAIRIADVRRPLREEVRERFGYCCGYCGVSELEAGAELTIDHFRPTSRGGGNEVANLVYCCAACNAFKGDYWSGDPAEQLLHPTDDPIYDHLAERSDGAMAPKTKRGALHIAVIHLNRPELVAKRADVRLRQDAAYRREELIRELAQVQRDIELLRDEFRTAFRSAPNDPRRRGRKSPPGV